MVQAIRPASAPNFVVSGMSPVQSVRYVPGSYPYPSDPTPSPTFAATPKNKRINIKKHHFYPTKQRTYRLRLSLYFWKITGLAAHRMWA